MNENLGLRILALVLAIILWAYVKVTTGDIAAQTIAQVTLELPIELKGAAPNLIPYEVSAENVKVTLRGSAEIVNQLREGIVPAFVDLTGMVPGSHWPEVKVLPPAGIDMTNQEPRSVNVRLSPLMVKEVPIEIVLDGRPADGMNAGDIKTDPTNIKLKGPEALVSTVDRVVGHIIIDGQSRTFSAEVANLDAVTEGGTLVRANNAQIHLVPKRVVCTVPIEARDRLVAIPVDMVNVRSSPPDGYTHSLEWEPEYVTVRVAEKVQVPAYLKTERIDFGNSSVNLEESAALEVPAGITVIGEDSIRVRLLVEKKKAPAKVSTSEEEEGPAEG